MMDNPDTQPNSAAKRLAITGALITGITMAIYSVVGGEATGAGALLAASALAFGLLATNLNWRPRQAASRAPPEAVEAQNGRKSGAGIAISRSSSVGGVGPTRHGQAVATEIKAAPITEREREVLSLVAEGYSNKLISAALGISERTVKNHLTLTMGKLRASDRTHAVVTAFRNGWLDI